MKRAKRFEREQGDINTTPSRRKFWERNLSAQAKKWFDEDTKYFLHQSLSTPVLNVLTKAQGPGTQRPQTMGNNGGTEKGNKCRRTRRAHQN